MNYTLIYFEHLENKLRKLINVETYLKFLKNDNIVNEI